MTKYGIIPNYLLFVLQYFYWFTERRLDNLKWREIE